MSKKSRRRNRRERERLESRAMAAWVPEITRAGETMGKAFVEMAKAVAPFVSAINMAIEKGILNLIASRTEFAASVRAALSSGDILPIMVFADWCEERGKMEEGRLAREVAVKMIDPTA